MKIGFIGVGHMGSSLATAIKDYKEASLSFNDVDKQKAISLKERIGGEVKDLQDIIKESDYLFIGVKPIDTDELLNKIKGIENHAVIISMVAGKTIKEIKQTVDNPVIRILPNTPVAIKSGLTLFNYSSDVTNNHLKTFNKFMKETGELVKVEEDKINPISVVTSSAPAYLDYFIDALIKALQKEGIEEKDATHYALMMCFGTIKLDLSSGKSPLELGKEVCSPNGSTIEGVNVLLNHRLYEVVDEAYHATLKKNNKMY